MPLPPWALAIAAAPERAPYFCEENAWRALLRVPPRAAVVFITNRTQHVAMWHQRAAVRDPVVWDYHVVVVVDDADGGCVVDVDCTAGVVLPRAAWLAASFRDVDEPLRPLFRVVPRAAFLASFSTDRRHMRSADGGWLQPPPPWAPPYTPALGHTLARFIDVDDDIAGAVVDVDGFASVALAAP
jgi:hypothetical protein